MFGIDAPGALLRLPGIHIGGNEEGYFLASSSGQREMVPPPQRQAARAVWKSRKFCLVPVESTFAAVYSSLSYEHIARATASEADDGADRNARAVGCAPGIVEADVIELRAQSQVRQNTDIHAAAGAESEVSG